MGLSSRLWVLIFIILGSHALKAQTKKERDVLYLKNNWILRGQLMPTAADSIKIKTSGDNVFSFSIHQVIYTKKEIESNNPFYRSTGFSNYTELGPLASKNTSEINVNTSAFSFQTVNGYKFIPPFFAGIGLGVDLYATQTFFPLFASFRGDISHSGTVMPYYFLDIGYGFNVTSYKNSNVIGNGGLLYALGGGIKINFNKASGFLLSLGYRVQNVSVTELATGIKNPSRYERIALRAGFYF